MLTCSPRADDSCLDSVILSLLHTFPFVVQGTHEIRPNVDGLNPHGYSQLYYSWHVSHKVCKYLSLVQPIIVQTLMRLSMQQITGVESLLSCP